MQLVQIRNHNRARLSREHHDDTRTAIADVEALRRDLEHEVAGEVRFDAGSRALYATDGSNYRQVPIGVIIPQDKDDVARAIAVARRHNAPVLSRGGGTSLAGQCCNVALVLDFSKLMYHVVGIDVENRLGRVQPGCVLDRLRDAAKAHGLTFGPDPATHTHCTLGGMLGNNSCGSHSLLAKNHGFGLRTSDNTHTLEILTYRGARFSVGPTSPEELQRIIARDDAKGRIYSKLKSLVDIYGDLIREGYPKLGRRVSGYNLDDLLPENGFHVARALVGGESTLVTILEAELHLVPNPKARTLMLLGYADAFEAAKHIQVILEYGPTALEGMDQKLFDWIKAKGDRNADVRLFPDAHGFLLVELSGESREESDAKAHELKRRLERERVPPKVRIYDDPTEEHMVWKVREGGLGSTAWVPGHKDTWEGWEDSAVPVERIAEYLPKLRDLFAKYGYEPALYGHFGQGCVHCRVSFDFVTKHGIDTYMAFTNEAADLVVSLGGSLSGEHGDGQSRGRLLPKMFGPQLMQAMREFKRIWDPDGRMSPGKGVVDSYDRDENLRLGADYDPPQLQTHMHYDRDQDDFSRAALRCVGVGKCRREHGGTMCPSYRVTREEQHSTRGRARLLFEMLEGEVITDGWRSDEVKEALDLCLSCKGCKGDCPVNVDMATYKAEFLSHYYEGRLRPRSAYAFGFIDRWARVAKAAPWLANALTQIWPLSALAKWMAGVDRRRRIPRFASQTFQDWFRTHTPRHPDGRRVVLFPDTFTNNFATSAAQAAVTVLEDAGYRVEVPQFHVCCGRPLYDYGFLDAAKRYWERLLTRMQQYIRDDLPMVVLEPSCWGAFKDELHSMMPHRVDAHRLADRTFTLADFLVHEAHYTPPPLPQEAILQGHCHEKALEALRDLEHGRLQSTHQLLDAMAVKADMPESGCCGMAGGFGYEAGSHYEVSQSCGELHLLPAVRDSDKAVIADGFSCRSQVEQGTGKKAVHIAEVMAQAIAARDGATLVTREPRRLVARVAVAALAVGTAAIVVRRLLAR